MAQEAFMAAVLSSDMDRTEKVVELISECRKLGIAVQAPTVNKSLFRFSVSGDKEIRYGLGALKGLGEGIVNSIVKEREVRGAYTDLVDLCRRNSGEKLSRRTLEALIKSGSLDDFGVSRSGLTRAIGQALRLTEQEMKAAESGQEDLFGLSDTSGHFSETEIDFVDAANTNEWTADEVLAAEKETLGLYLSGHPLDRYREELKNFVSSSLVELRPGKRRVVGLLMGVRIITAKRGRMAVANLDDQTARVDVSVLRGAFDASIEKFVEGQLVVIEGNCSVDEYTGDNSLEVARIYGLEEARNHFAKMVILDLSGEQLENGLADTVGALISAHQGDCPVIIDYCDGSAIARLRLGAEWKVRVTDRLVESLQKHVGERNVRVEY
jgi:DNA polymerase-3 subunit alpha